MKIIFLGTGHGSATATNMSSVTYLECGGKTWRLTKQKVKILPPSKTAKSS